ncbi:EAL domain-containing protein [Pseudoxanthomonas sp. CF125]|uniref:EAL domain-containing protein n=1 Tax=Pseudoxanthomonas sp. CF125 TaxID=1855303 RepID=UPI00088B8E26|nr:EAL domain-containing protein [Pseudoxanthomonas sp. CF125]SDQ82473.1 EAL domain, c-di-GMP-specific phosphodiesterase class I (or its enzymatically inactive variant) [Pseudoxanthomonas sp. CF125]
MSAIEPTSRPQDEPLRSRLRAEKPPSHYWRRWTDDAPAEEPATTLAAKDAPAPKPDAADETTATMPAAAKDTRKHETGQTPFRILIVEDDRGQALFAQSVLHGAGMQAEVEMAPDSVIGAIERFKPDLVLMDLHMPGRDGMSLTMQIRQRPELLHLPIVFLTGDPDPEREYEVLESGADDFLTKPIRPRHLIAAVSNRIQRARQRVPLTAAPQLTLNPETGLPTRAYLMLQLGNALEEKTPGGLFFIEISGTLGLRERYGYANFENLMAAAGRELALAAAPHPLARLNDNSFLALAKDLDADSMAALARRLRERLGQHDFPVRADESLRLAGAVGYAAIPHTFSDTGSALEATERAALLARQQSEGIAAYTPPEAGDEVGFSLSDADLELAYQPIVSVAGNNLAQYQVFLRMRQADGTLVPAAQAVPAAEMAGRIVDLDRQVMERVLDLLSQSQSEGRLLRLFVSQSPRSLAREAFADWLLQDIAARGIEGTSLIIDLRLDDALIHSVTLRQFCNRLMTAGVQFCLSQFEPGREAEALLTQLPLGYLRVASRYAAAHNDPALRDQLRGMIDLAHRMGLQVIGQQIEDPQAAAAMWMGGVDFIQGNLVQGVGSDLGFDFHNAVL